MFRCKAITDEPQNESKTFHAKRKKLYFQERQEQVKKEMKTKANGFLLLQSEAI